MLLSFDLAEYEQWVDDGASLPEKELVSFQALLFCLDIQVYAIFDEINDVGYVFELTHYMFVEALIGYFSALCTQS